MVAAASEQTLIELRGIRKSFGDNDLLCGVDLEVRRGETVVIIGPPGNGKSVLLKIVAGLLEPDAGEVLIEGESITHARGQTLDKIRRRMGMLFQNYALFDSMDVRGNLSFAPQELTDLSESEIDAKVKQALDWVKLRNVENLRPSELSGGMKKRVGLARAWVMNPEILIYDEPTAGLDPVTAERINVLIKAFAKENQTTAVVVTQEMLSAFSIADRLAFLCDGKILEIGTPEELRASSNPYVRQFLNGELQGPITAKQEEAARAQMLEHTQSGAEA